MGQDSKLKPIIVGMGWVAFLPDTAPSEIIHQAPTSCRGYTVTIKTSRHNDGNYICVIASNTTHPTSKKIRWVAYGTTAKSALKHAFKLKGDA